MLAVDPIPSERWRGGLLDAATVLNPGDPHFALGVHFEPVCGNVHNTLGACLWDESTPDKTEDSPYTLVEGHPFTLYNLTRCRLVGVENARQRALDEFNLGEELGLEEEFSSWFPTLTTTAVGTVVGARFALALAEEYASDNYGGEAVIHMNRHTASLLAGVSLEMEGGVLRTMLGTKVAAGGGNADSVMRVTGPVGIWRGEQIATDQVPDLSPPINEYALLVERPYVIATSCLAGEVTYDQNADPSATV